MPKPTYAEKLKDQRWQKRRLYLLEAANWTCQGPCQNQKSNPNLSVHHRLYLRNTDPWDYEDWAYQVLCDECHEAAQSQMEEVAIALAKNRELFDLCGVLSRKHPGFIEAFASTAFMLCVVREELEPSLLRDLQRLLDSRDDIIAAWQSVKQKEACGVD